MICNTKAIVLKTIKFQETSLIVKCYTTQGIKSYFLKGILNRKSKKSKIKPAFFQPFTLLQLVANHNNKGRLNYIKETVVYHPLHNLHTNIYKNTIVLFLSEILNNVLIEEEENPLLYSYLENSLIWLDTHDKTSNFHILFMLNLTKYLGFYPKTNGFKDAFFFDLKEGIFTKSKPAELFLDNNKIILFKQLIGINFDALSKLQFNVNQRQELLSILLKYYGLHLPGFKEPKSLSVLHSVFN